MSIIVVVRVVLSIASMSGLCAVFTLSVRISNSYDTFTALFLLLALGDVPTVSYLS